MKLARLATIAVPTEPEGWGKLTLCMGEVEVGVLFTKDVKSKHTLFVAAVSSLKHRVKITKGGFAVIPEKQRIESEQCIEHYANILSVFRNTTRKISSPSPSVALIAENKSEFEYLSTLSGIKYPIGNRAIADGVPDLDLDENLANISDRMDGVALIAEARAHNHASGRFRECVRLFERAFGLAGQKLKYPLSNFLEGGNLGYSYQEIENWIEIRDKVTHADLRSDVAFESDSSWVVGRAIQATYDVLLNKTMWRSADAGRRNCWQPPYGTSSPEMDLFLTKGFEWKSTMSAFDEFRRFPSNLSAHINRLPDMWWAGNRTTSRDASLMRGQLEVRPNPKES